MCIPFKTIKAFVFLFLLLMISACYRGVRLDYPPNNQVTLNESTEVVVFQIDQSRKNIKTDPNKHYQCFFANSIKVIQGAYSGKLLHGKYEKFDKDNNLKNMGYFNYGLKEGVWKEWHPSGNLLSEITYSKGEKNGIFKIYNEEGKVKEEGKYSKGLISGKVMMVDASGHKTYVRYKNGLEIPDQEHKDEKGAEVPKKEKDKRNWFWKKPHNENEDEKHEGD